MKLFAFLVLLSLPNLRAEVAPAALAHVHSAMQQFIEKKEAAGIVTAVGTKDRVLHLSAVGQADVEKGMPMSAQSVMWIASMTKPITALAIMNLRDQGKLSLEDAVAKHVPSFAQLKEKITIRQLLTHTSGLADKPKEIAQPKTLGELVDLYPTQALLFPPGTQWQYCNSGINTLGRIVEILSGQEFAQHLHQTFFAPLNLKDTTFHPTAEQAQRLARTYKKKADGTLDPTTITILLGGVLTPPAESIPFPAGGLFSTAQDLIKFYQMVLAGGEAQGHRFIKAETLKEMTALQTGELKTGFTSGASWGYGWARVAEPQGATAALSAGSFGHGGAYGTQIWIDPTAGRFYLLMLQRADIGNADGSDLRKVFQDTAAAALK